MSFRFVNHSVDLDIYEYSGSLGWPHIIVLLMINAVIESSSDKDPLDVFLCYRFYINYTRMLY